MPHRTIYATLIGILTIGAASAQTDKPGLPGYTNILRSGQEKDNVPRATSGGQKQTTVNACCLSLPAALACLILRWLHRPYHRRT